MSETTATETPGDGEIHERTAEAAAMFTGAGAVAGAGVTAFAVAYVGLPVDHPWGALAVGLLGATLMAWLALRTLPDAKTVALYVDEARELTEDHDTNP